MPMTPRFPGELRTTLRQGRWLLTAAETLVSALVLVLTRSQSPALYATLAALALYNAAAILALRRPTMPRLLVPAMIVLDLAFILLAARLTGGVQSPFLGLSYLIILAAALWYDLPGGVAIGAAASGVAVAAHAPSAPFTMLQMHLLWNFIPSYLLAGGFTGFLVLRLKGYYERDVASRLRQQADAREMQLAREMQAAAFPTGPPHIPGLECAFLSRSAGQVGGDFLLFLTPETGKTTDKSTDTGTATETALLGILIGDVSGKGIPAALASTGIAHLLPWLNPLRDPAQALHALNDDLNDRLPGESYATLIYAHASVESVQIWTAGHPPALLWRASEKRVVMGEAVAYPPLGLFPNWQGEGETIPWAVGDILLMYTDGANETRNAGGVQFTTERIADTLTAAAEASPEEIIQRVFQAVENWGTPIDDLTLAVCKRVEPPVLPPSPP